MNSDKLKQIIEDKNSRLEQAAVNTAADLIEEIVKLKECNEKNSHRIAELQAELKALEVKSIDPSILG